MSAAHGMSLGRSLAGVARDDLRAGSAVLRRHERRAWRVALISGGVMAAELAAGAWLNSLALQSDGLHAGSHAGVLLIAAAAYRLAAWRGADPGAAARLLDLAALCSGVILAVAAVALGVEAVERLLQPQPVRFGEAAAFTALGLLVSGVSAAVLRGGHARAHVDDGDAHAHGRDLNLWAAYLHMLADVVTSVLALAALLLGLVTGWARLDAAVGALNALVVAAFAGRLLVTAVRALRRMRTRPRRVRRSAAAAPGASPG